MAAMKQKVDIIGDQTDRNSGHGDSFDNDKKGFNLHIAKRPVFIGRLVQQRNEKNGRQEHEKFNAVINSIQKDGLGTCINSHDQL